MTRFRRIAGHVKVGSVLVRASDGQRFVVKHISKYNEHHDERGRFAASDGGSADYLKSDSVLLTIPRGTRQFEVLTNPSMRDLQSMGRETEYGDVRITTDANGNLYAWKADEALHEQFVRAAKQRWPNAKWDKIIPGHTWGTAVPSMLRADQRAKIERGLANAKLAKFNPNHDQLGRFSSGPGAGEAFVSPHTGENLSFAAARDGLNSPRQQQLQKASSEINNALGLHALDTPVIGAWSDGAENSLLTTMPGATLDEIRAATAMKGYLANQKAVLAFQPDANGESFMATFPASGDLDAIHSKLLQDGLAFHTLEPRTGGALVHVFGQDEDTFNAAEKSSGSKAHFVRGNGEFIGTTIEGSDAAQRADARQVYDRVIRGTRLAGRDVAQTWDDVRARWGPILKFNPNHDEHGRFATSPGGSVVAYHGTTEKVARRIQQEGLHVTKQGHHFGTDVYGGERGESVFIAASEAKAVEYAEALAQSQSWQDYKAVKPIIFKMEIPADEWRAFHEDTMEDPGAAAYGKLVKPEWITGTYEIGFEQDRHKLVPAQLGKQDKIIAWMVVVPKPPEALAKILHNVCLEVVQKFNPNHDERGRFSSWPGAGKVEDIGMHVYHGSHATFDEFSREKLGTGEGHQTFGYGTYVAESPKVAETYRTAGAGAYTIDGKNLNEFLRTSADYKEELVARNLFDGKSPYDPGEWIHGPDDTLGRGAWDKLNEMMRSGRLVEQKGRLYDVALHADPGKMLDLDAPFEKQPKAVQDLVRNYIRAPHSASLPWSENALPHGQAINIGLSNIYGSDKAAAQVLQEAGVPGIRYLDQGSRKRGKGTHNYVVFNPKDLSVIVRKFRKFRKFNPYHDERGRFSSADSAGTQLDLFSKPLTRPELQNAVRKVASRLGFDADRIEVSDHRQVAVVDGKEYPVSGQHDPRTGEVQIFLPNVQDKPIEAAEGTLAHEIEHAKFHAVIAHTSGYPDARRADPGADRLFDYMTRHFDDYAEADGVSPYSRFHWDRWLKGDGDPATAMHETLAEMSRIKYLTGKFPDHQGDAPHSVKMWRDLYVKIDQMYPRLKRLK